MRLAGSGRGISRAREAFWRNRRPNRAVSGNSSRINCSASSPVKPSNRSSGGSSRFGRRKRRPSSACRHAGVSPNRRRMPSEQRELQPEVELAAEGRQDGQAELSRLVGERFDQDRPIIGHDPGQPLLSAEELPEHPRGGRLEPALALEPGEELGIIEPAGDLAAECPDRFAHLGRARRRLPVPEGHDARVSLRFADEDAMRLDRVDPPGRIAEDEGLADPPLEDEFLVQLAQPRSAVPEVDRELARVGDRPAADEREMGRPGQRGQPVVDRVPRHPGAKVAKPGVGNRPETSRRTLSKASAERSW